MALPLEIFPSPLTALNDSRADTQLIRPILDSLANKISGEDHKIVDRFVVSHLRSEGHKAYHILPRILKIIDTHHPVFGSSGLAQTIESNINNVNGESGLLHELELFHLVEGSRHRTTPTLLRSKINDQEIDIRTRFFDGINVLFEAKLGRTRGSQSQFHRLVNAAMKVGAKLVYVSASDIVHDDGIVSLSDLERMLDRDHPDSITARFNLAHKTNLLEFERDKLELLPKPELRARIRTRIESSRRARSRLKNRENRENVALLDNQLRTLSCVDATNLWDWIAADPELADERFQLLYEYGVAELIVEDVSGQMLNSVLNS